MLPNGHLHEEVAPSPPPSYERYVWTAMAFIVGIAAIGFLVAVYLGHFASAAEVDPLKVQVAAHAKDLDEHRRRLDVYERRQDEYQARTDEKLDKIYDAVMNGRRR